MSAQVTIQRTFTTTTTSAVLLNVGYLKTLPGLLKIFQIILGCVATGIIGYHITWNTYSLRPELFFILITTTCLITTTIIVFSCIFSIATASILSKTLFETTYHLIATALYIAAGVTLLVYVNDYRYRSHGYEAKTAAGIVSANGTEFYLLFCASVNLLRELVARNQLYNIKETGYHSKLFSGSIGLVNAGLYLLSTIYSIKNFRRG